VLRVVWSELVHRRGRTFALLAGIIVATTSFAVLTGTSSTQRLEVQGTVARSFRGDYDILVRPNDSRSARERRTAAVQANFLSGITGGISMRQWRRIEKLPGVGVAAPLANVGYVMPTAEMPIDISRALPANGRALVRADVTWRSERGLTRVPDAPDFAYVTDDSLRNEPPESQADPYRRYSLREGDAERPVCYAGFDTTGLALDGPFSPLYRSQLGCFSRDGGRGRWFFGPLRSLSPRVVLRWSFPLLLTAVDPDAEARLTGLDRRVRSGRYLRASDKPQVSQPRGRRKLPARFLPVLAADRIFVDEQADVALRRVDERALDRWRRPFDVDGDTLSPLGYLLRAPAGPISAREQVGAAAAYRQLLRELRDPDRYLFEEVSALWRIGPAGQVSRPADPLVWKNSAYSDWAFPSPAARDRAFRAIEPFVASGAGSGPDTAAPTLRAVGTFDPGETSADTRSTEPPLTTLQPPALTARDTASDRQLGGRPLRPNTSLGGYLTQPPALLTSLRAARAFGPPTFPDLDRDKPISAVRVRVTGVTGADAVSRERIRQAAQRIATQTGLDVDITAGASGAPTALDLPAGRFGRPALALDELWIRKGVATRVLDAVDRKSLVLFALILVVCSLFVTNATSAAVGARRTELGVMSAVGWDTRRLFTVVLLEVGVIGIAAGVTGALLSLPLAAVAGVGASVPRAAAAAAAATLLALLAGLVPALRAARSNPVEAIAPVVLDARKAWRPRGLGGLALINLVRTPGRTALAALSVAFGVCALTLLVAVTVAFKDTLVGTLLGDAVAIDVRGTDYLAVAAMIFLSAAAVADVLYLNVRDRAAELATLRATGWDETVLGRLIAAEGLAIGALGGSTGALVGLCAAALFAGAVPLALVGTAIGTALVGMLLAVLAALAPAAWLRRAPMLALLAGE
jgi:ABC-type lipoprotein release transport system permease subunit